MLCLVLLLAGGVEATPLVVGDGRDQVTASDVADLCALAATPSPLGEPVLIRATLSYRDGRTPALNGVMVYLAPTETSARSWRGGYLACYPVTLRHPGDEFYHWREAGKWMVGGTSRSGEYMVLSSPGKELPAFTPEGIASDVPAYLKTQFDTRTILDVVDTARAYRQPQTNGSEQPLANLAVKTMATSARDDGCDDANVAFQPPPGEAPISAQMAKESGKDWRVVRINRWVRY